MRAVRGTGDFGIRKAFPAAEQKTIAIKNGWVDRQAEQEYHVSCLAIGDGWVIGVMAKLRDQQGLHVRRRHLRAGRRAAPRRCVS